MLFMNRYEVIAASLRYALHPVLGPATKFLLAFMNEVDANSDGWAFWSTPLSAARQLMELIHNPSTATDKGFRKALGPIRAFYTRKGYAVGMQFPEVTL